MARGTKCLQPGARQRHLAPRDQREQIADGRGTAGEEKRNTPRRWGVGKLGDHRRQLGHRCRPRIGDLIDDAAGLGGVEGKRDRRREVAPRDDRSGRGPRTDKAPAPGDHPAGEGNEICCGVGAVHRRGAEDDCASPPVGRRPGADFRLGPRLRPAVGGTGRKRALLCAASAPRHRGLNRTGEHEAADAVLRRPVEPSPCPADVDPIGSFRIGRRRCRHGLLDLEMNDRRRH